MKERQDLVGQKFGRLTAIAYVKSPDTGQKRVRWAYQCLCECGNTVIVKGSKLTGEVGSRTVSCKCLMAEKTFPGSQYTTAHRVLANYVQSAKRRNLDWLLSEEVGIELLSGDCHYCGEPPVAALKSRSIKRARKDGFAYNGIDRRNPSVGYTEGNCVSCCSTCNYFKAGMTEEEFTQQIIKIYRHAVSK